MKGQVLYKGKIYRMYKITDDDGHCMYIRIDKEQNKVSQSETGNAGTWFDITHSVYLDDLLHQLGEKGI